MAPKNSFDPVYEQLQHLAEFQYRISSIYKAQSVEEKTSKLYQLFGQSPSRAAPNLSPGQFLWNHQSAETSTHPDSSDNTAGTMSNYDQEDYYPTDRIYEILGKNKIFGDSRWHEDLIACLEMLNEKLGSPRLTNLHELWSSGFEDLQLKRLERSLPTVQIILDDINRERKELHVWKVQHRHLKDLLCEAGDILDDFALRAPHLKQLFQSPQVTTHPYLTDKLLQIDNLIVELNDLAEEIKSKVLPEFNTRRRKAPGRNIPLAISSGEKNNHPTATPGADDISKYSSAVGSIIDRRNEVTSKTKEEIISHWVTESMDSRKNWDTESMDLRKNWGTESVEPRKNLDIDSMDRGNSRVTDSMGKGNNRLDELTTMTTHLASEIIHLHQRFDELQASLRPPAVKELSFDEKDEEDPLDNEDNARETTPVV